LKRPKAERKVVRTLPLHARQLMLAAAESPRDRLGSGCSSVSAYRSTRPPARKSVTSTSTVRPYT
jgi:hypothetical protein